MTAAVAPAPSPTALREPVLVVADIIQAELALAADHVMLDFEKDDIPKDPGLFVALGYIGPAKVIANVNTFDPVTTKEVQTATLLYVVQIDFMSFDSSARLRLPEVAMALNSVLSQQLQDKYQLQIARQPAPFVDAHSLEETKILNRFVTTVQVTALHRKEKPVAVYDTFPTPEVHENA